MTINQAIFARDPLATAIPNEGVTKLGEPATEQERSVLRWELQSFVCEGEYRLGLERILSTYLTSLSQDMQPAVWVSGFYGSGKSHLVRVLEYLWRDYAFPDGATARGLASLPDDISALLKELSTAGRREGGLWTAAGSPSGTAGSVRLGVLGIALAGAGLPEQYGPARFVIWLRENGRYTAFAEALAARGREPRHELANMYVSPWLAEALIEAVPNLGAANTREAATLLRTQYGPREEIADEELLQTIESVLRLQSSAPGKLPCTLLVLDELQQFISEDPQRTLQVQSIVEACSSRFGSRLLFVGTGQQEMQATEALSKLQGRFSVRVMLSDKDVETVVREVVLRKREDRKPELAATLERVSGEIDRQLAGTRIGPGAADHGDLVADYPLLPARRRFWEAVLREVDTGGRAGQLRTQLRIVHEAARSMAGRQLGCVVAGDFIYGQLAADMQQSGVLLRETATTIAELDDGTADGRLRSRLCAAIMLAGRLPADGPAATGVRATATTLADLLVEDLNAGSDELRRRIPELLEGLVRSGRLMALGDEYRLQTREGAEWDADYRRRLTDIQSNTARIAEARTAALRAAVKGLLDGIVLQQGDTKETRRLLLRYGSEPEPEGAGVQVWVRDGWFSTEATVQADAQTAGTDSPVVHAFLPQRGADALRSALASSAAAAGCLAARPEPATGESEEARQARQSMSSRRDAEGRTLGSLAQQVLAAALVFQGGGADVPGETLTAMMKAAKDALVRLYPRFNLADDPGWAKVIQRARQGAGDALQEVGHGGDVEQHAVCREVRGALGAAGKRGGELRQRFRAAPYGWPQDAVDGALLALVAAGLVRAARNGQPLSARQINQGEIGGTEFQSEGVTVSVQQKIAVRRLLGEAEIQAQPDHEAEHLSGFLQRLLDWAGEAGGEPPLPPAPDTSAIVELRALRGNEQMVAVYEQRDRLRDLLKDWTEARQRIRGRLPRWQMLERLLAQAGRDSEAGAAAEPIRTQADAIRAQRSLLDDPDPVAPLLDGLAGVLRSALQAARSRLIEERQRQIEALAASDAWQRLPEAERGPILAEQRLAAVPDVALGGPQELLASLDAHPLPEWQDLVDALPARAAAAREAAAKRLEPATIALRPRAAMLKTEPEVDDYLRELRGRIMAEIGAGRPVLLG